MKPHPLALRPTDLENLRKQGFEVRKYNTDELHQINKTGPFSMVDNTRNRPNKRDNPKK